MKTIRLSIHLAVLPAIAATLFFSVARADDVVPLLEESVATQARVDVIQRAKKEIRVEYFYVGGDDYSLGGMALLVDAAKRGVHVRVMLDSIFAKIPLSLYVKLMDQAVGPDGKINLEIKIYNPIGINPFKWSHRNHAKLLIADQGDQRVLISGGRNVGGEYFGLEGKRNFDDYDVMTRGSIADAAIEDFDTNWNSGIGTPVRMLGITEGKPDPSMCGNNEAYDSCTVAQDMLRQKLDADEARLEDMLRKVLDTKPGGLFVTNSTTDWFADSYKIKKTRFMSHDPNKLVSRKSANLSRDLLEILRSAKTDVNIISPYLIPTDNVIAAFQMLIAKGVRIRIITNSMKSTDNLLAQAGYRSMQKELTEMGVEIWEYKGPNTVHAKTALIDHNHILVGTYNMDPRSAFLNREVGLSFVDDENVGFAKYQAEMIEQFRERSVLVAKDGVAQNVEWQKAEISVLTQQKLNVLRVLMPFIKHQL